MARVIRFGAYELDPASGDLRRRGRRLHRRGAAARAPDAPLDLPAAEGSEAQRYADLSEKGDPVHTWPLPD